MRKFKSSLLMLIFTLGLLSGCSNERIHTVEFYTNSNGEFYKAVTVHHNEKVSRPPAPEAPTNFTFDNWWVDQNYSAKFDFNKPIKKDTTIFGKWVENRPYVADERIFHIVGETTNPASNFINWNAVGEEGEAFDVRSYLTKDEFTNLYSIELSLDTSSKFKVKVAGATWGSDTEFSYGNIDILDQHEYIGGADHDNIEILEDGLYKIEVETTYMWAKVTRIGEMN